MKKVWLVTGGAGFIGAHFIHQNLSEEHCDAIVNLDLLTYAGDASRLAHFGKDTRYHFVQGNICDESLVHRLLLQFKPCLVINFAAESHVDRSIKAPRPFVETNIKGVLHLLEASKHYYQGLSPEAQAAFRFLQISTDEVFGSIKLTDSPQQETARYNPTNPYAASKAAADHLVRSYGNTYGLPILITHSSNNYGPNQYPEKLIPMMIQCLLRSKPVPIYGDGSHRRDWLHVTDHVKALLAVIKKGKIGESYNICSGIDRSNIEVAQLLCEIFDELNPRPDGRKHFDLIQFVADRPGHDFRYALDCSKIFKELGWGADISLKEGSTFLAYKLQ